MMEGSGSVLVTNGSEKLKSIRILRIRMRIRNTGSKNGTIRSKESFSTSYGTSSTKINFQKCPEKSSFLMLLIKLRD
jgi:hypothetical protein